MPNAIPFVPKQIAAGNFSDVPIPAGGDVGKALVWNTTAFTYTAFEASGAVATHAALADPHTQYLLSSSYTAADVLAKLLTVDTDGSGLNATTLQGNAPGAFATSGHNHSGTYQPLDSELTAIAGLVSAANTVPSFTGSGTAALLTVGTAAGNLVKLDGTAKLPAVDGSQLTGITVSGYLAATGATTGATSSVQPFTLGIKAPSIQPASDSTTAVRVFKADGTTAVVTVDTTNGRVGIGATPSYLFDVSGSGNMLRVWNGTNTGVVINSNSVKNAISTNTLTISGGTDLIFETYNGGFIERARFNNSGMFGLGASSPASKLHIAGNLSASAWTTNGIAIQSAAATYTDSSTATSGTAATAVFNSFAQPTLAASNTGVTTTRAATVYIANAPTAGTNQTITNAYALWIDNGAARFDGNVGFFSTEPAAQQTGGSATASGTYGATEQTMIQRAYDCLRTFGLLS